jgi:DNA ligase-1
MRIGQPMLCARAESEQDIEFPCLATPKLDGIRAMIVEGKAVTRRFSLVGNLATRRWMEANLPEGIDGELMVPDADFSDLSGLIRRGTGDPKAVFHAFDLCSLLPYRERAKQLRALVLPERCQLVLPILCENVTDLLLYEEKCLADGYEGVITRSLDGPYKFGRSSLREQYMVKLKRFQDSEAVIVSFEELEHNLNPQVENVFGRMKRPGGAAGKVPGGTLGTLVCRDVHSGVDIRIGGGKGMTQALRQEIWDNRPSFAGRVLRYEYQAVGSKDKPRFPRFAGWVDANTLDRSVKLGL